MPARSRQGCSTASEARPRRLMRRHPRCHKPPSRWRRLVASGRGRRTCPRLELRFDGFRLLGRDAVVWAAYATGLTRRLADRRPTSRSLACQLSDEETPEHAFDTLAPRSNRVLQRQGVWYLPSPGPAERRAVAREGPPGDGQGRSRQIRRIPQALPGLQAGPPERGSTKAIWPRPLQAVRRRSRRASRRRSKCCERAARPRPQVPARRSYGEPPIWQ